MKCPECSNPLATLKRGRKPTYCSQRCRMRAHRKRLGNPSKISKEAEETIALLRKQLARQEILLSRQAEEPSKFAFPVIVEGGRWHKIKSTSELRPGTVVRLFGHDHANVILANDGRVLTLQDLRDGCLGDLSIFDAKASWRRNSPVRHDDLVQQWIDTGKPKRYVADWKAEAERLEAELRKQSNLVRALKRPNYSMAVRIEKATGRSGYVAQHINGNEWAQGSTAKEALGDLVFGHAVKRTVTIVSIEFSDQDSSPSAKKKQVH